MSLKFFRMPFINSTSSRNQDRWDNLCLTKICGQKSDWLRLTKESSHVQRWVRGRSAGSFLEQRLVIEPKQTVSLKKSLIKNTTVSRALKGTWLHQIVSFDCGRGIHPKKALEDAGLKTLFHRREELCGSLFKQIVESDQHKLAGLLPASNDSERYNFRTRRMFSIPNVKTKRFKNTFIIYFATKQHM